MCGSEVAKKTARKFAVHRLTRVGIQLGMPLLGDGPIWRRSLDKPRGYPGDYGILNFVYDRDDQGESAYARLCHRLGLDVGDCVRTRMQLVVAELAALLRSKGDEMRSL